MPAKLPKPKQRNKRLRARGHASTSVPFPTFNFHSAPGRFFKAQDWRKHWMEFCTARRQDGSYQYPTAWSFICSKTERAAERTVMYWCIGPRPNFEIVKRTTHSGKPSRRAKSPVPWLGDWTLQRNSLSTYSSKKLVALQALLEERFDALQASRGVADITVDDIARWDRLSKRVDLYFGGVDQVLPEIDYSALTPEERHGALKEAKARFDFYTDLQRTCMSAKSQMIELFLHCHGIAGEDQITALANMAVAGVKAGSAAALTGASAAGALNAAGKPLSPTALSLAKMMCDKAEIFDLPLPETTAQDKRAEDTEEAVLETVAER